MAYTILTGDPRAPGTVNPSGDANNVNDVLLGMGAGLNPLSTAFPPAADPTGVGDSTAALNAALAACPPGGTVLLPANYYSAGAWHQAFYKTSATLTVPLGVGLVGIGSASFGVPAANYGIGGLALQGAVIQPASPFTNSSGGAAVITMQAAGGVQNGGQRLEKITIDGSNAPVGNNMHGIAMLDAVACVTLRDVTVYGAQNLGGDGLHAVASPTHPPDLINMFSCHWAGMQGWGVSMSGVADSYINSCEATGCATGGWNITNCNNTRFVGCKGEQSSAGPGWLFTALGGFTGIVHVLACTSQFNNTDGFRVTGAGTGTYQLIGCSADTDGTNGGSGGGGFAGLQVSSFAGTVLAEGFNCRVTGSTPSPQYGVAMTSSSTLRIDNANIAGATSATHDGGGNTQFYVGFGAGGPLSALSMASQKITSLANGSGAQDAAAFGQIPVVESTIGNIKATSTAASLGSSGKWPDSDHVHAQNFGGVFGDGSDGSVTFDGSTTILGMVPAGSAYTMTRDIYVTSATINNGVTLKTANYQVFCQGTVTNNGTVSNNGGNAAGSTGGTAPNAGTLRNGTAGAGGGTGVNGTGGTSTGLTSPGAGTGGNGGAGTSGSAGSAGTLTGGSQSGIYRGLSPTATVAQFASNSFIFAGGIGGGGGGSDASSNAGGGGGAGGGMIKIAAWSVVNNGTISAAGGNGANGAAGNAGGGGAGGGGIILIYTLSAWTAGTTSVAAGTHGNGSGTGSAGGNGGSGEVLNVVIA